jgi:hypothetical protein
MSKKPRSDAKLLSLPPHYREALIRWLTEENLSYADARDRLKKEYSVSTSTGALSQFYATQCFSLRYSQAREVADTVAEQMAQSPEKFDEATIALIKQKAFERAVAKDGDLDELQILAKMLHDSTKLRLKVQDQVLQERRVALLEKKAALADKASAVTADAELTDAEKLKRYKQIFGGG